MNKKLRFTLWGVLFCLCAGLGFASQPGTALKILMNLLSFGFFAVGGWILYEAKLRRDMAAAALVRALSLASLAVTLTMLVANFLSVFAPEWVGNLLHHMLVVVSSPMFCAPNWAVSLFLWACLMAASHKMLRKKSR